MAEDLEEMDSEVFESKEVHGALLTIEEMQELLHQEPYKPYDDAYSAELSYDEQSGMYYTDFFRNEAGDEILLRHLLAEQCIMHSNELDWCRVTDGYDASILATIIGLYLAPLAWCEIPSELKEHYVIVGKIAHGVKEDRPGKEDLMSFLLNDIREKRALWFIDHLPDCGIAKWENFLSHYRRADLLKAMGCNCDYLKFPHLNWYDLQENLEYVIKYRGIKKAQEVLECLRKDWNHLVKLKMCRFDKLSEEEIEALHDFVFDKVNYQMDVWAGEYGLDNKAVMAKEPVQQLTNPDGELFKYIHYTIVDDAERMRVHKAVCNIVRLPKMPQVMDGLKDLMDKNWILSTIKQDAMLAELRRLGLPDCSTPGFSDNNFFSAYKNTIGY